MDLDTSYIYMSCEADAMLLEHPFYFTVTVLTSNTLNSAKHPYRSPIG